MHYNSLVTVRRSCAFLTLYNTKYFMLYNATIITEVSESGTVNCIHDTTIHYNKAEYLLLGPSQCDNTLVLYLVIHQTCVTCRATSMTEAGSSMISFD